MVVKNHHRHAHSPSTHTSRKHRILAGAFVLLGLLAAGTYGIVMNVDTADASLAEVSGVLHRDAALGVEASLLRPVEHRLESIRESRIAGIPARYFGSLAGYSHHVDTVRQQALGLLAVDRRYQQQLAVTWGHRLMAEEGRFSPLTAAGLRSQVSSKASLRQLGYDARMWRNQVRRWQAAVVRLAAVSGGLSAGKPHDVLRADQQLSARLAQRGPYWQGVSGAEAALALAREYWREPPAVQLTQHQTILGTMTHAMQHLGPPTQAELLTILANESRGLAGQQPADVAHALASLQSRLASANAQWTGYQQAEQAVTAADAYLALPFIGQIQQHAAMLSQLADASSALRPPVPMAPPGGAWQTAVQQYLATRQTVLSIAVFNANTGTTTTLNPGLSFDTASIVKATIMATLLWQSERLGQPLSVSEQNLMVPMIEQSNNNAATMLWFDAGQASGIGAFLRAAGMASTIPGQNGYWGLTQTTPLDQVDLMKLLSYPNGLLTPASQAYAANLMEHIVNFEDWGVSSGASGHAVVALKNGWLPIGTQGWEINSIGHVAGDGRNYVIALLSRNNPTEAYGIQTLDTVSQLIWNTL